MTEELRPDLCIIGAGAGGLMVAVGSAALRARTVLVEAGRMGGQHLNTGTIPWAAFRAALPVGRAPDWDEIYAAVRRAVADRGRNDSAHRLRSMGVTVLNDTARFTSRDSVQVGATTVRARRFVLATGSRPILPAIPGLETVRALTPDTLLGAEIRPERLLIIGADAQTLEIAQAYAACRVPVTIVTPAPALWNEDPEIDEALRRAAERDGIVIRAPASLDRIEPTPGGVRLHISGEDGPRTEDASHLVAACGREPVLAGLGLEAAAIAVRQGRLVVRHDGRTTNRRVYAVGDVCSPRWATTTGAQAQGRLVLRTALMRAAGRFRPEDIPSVTHTRPAVARAGLGEREVRSARVVRWPFADIDAGAIHGAATGHVKLVLDRRGTLVGATILGSRADELIALCQLATSRRMAVRDLAALPLPAPVFGEAVVKAATAAITPRLRSPWIGRWLALTRKLG